MKNILATTALALMMSTPMATGAWAAGEMKPLASYTQAQPTDIKASNFIGMRVYATESADYDNWTMNTRMSPGSEKQWDDIGEVNDVILGRDGQVKAVVLGVGGFIGIGEKDVAVQMSDIKMLSEEGSDSDFFLVVKTNKEMLEQMDAYQQAAEAATDVDMNMGSTTTASSTASADIEPEETAEAQLENTNKPAGQESAASMVRHDMRMERGAMASENEQMAVLEEKMEEKRANEVDTTTTGSISKEDANLDGAGREMLIRPSITRDGYVEPAREELTAEMLTGARVYGTTDQDIGEVGELLLDENNEIDRLVLDIGGFLGLAEHNVAVTMDEVQIIRGEDGTDVRVYVDATQEQLEAQPEYEG
ncbi:MAG: PRC-barrel domain-containing protein [Pseudomonadota bacterium]